MKRLLTALVAVPLALAAVFWLPLGWFLVAVILLLEVAIFEFARLGRQSAAGVPVWVLMPVVPAVALVACLEILGSRLGAPGSALALLAAAIVPVGFGSLALFSGADLPRALSGLGLLAFGLPYFSLPIIALSHLKWADPWMLLMMLAVVWVGDTFAFYCGTKWGRHKLAPVVSPHKSWEGAAAGFVGSMLAAGAFLLWRPELDGVLLVPAAVAAVAAQVGDLVESLIKRAAGVKDSGRLLPGHGGVLDRIDALLFAAPVWYLGLRVYDVIPAGP